MNVARTDGCSQRLSFGARRETVLRIHDDRGDAELSEARADLFNFNFYPAPDSDDIFINSPTARNVRPSVRKDQENDALSSLPRRAFAHFKCAHQPGGQRCRAADGQRIEQPFCQRA